MKAIQVPEGGGLDNLQCVELSQPEPGVGEILVRWRASSLNYHDYLTAIGVIPVEEGRIPMSDGAGDVVAVGEGVDQWQEGDKVMSVFYPDWIEGQANKIKTTHILGEQINGCAVEYAVLPASAVTSIPDNYSYAEAATLPCAGLTVWRGLIVEAGMQAGNSVLVQGTGGVSIFALQLAKAAGAKVYATTSSDEKAERLKALGADEVINYKKDPKWGVTISKLSGGIDHVVDLGGGATMEQSIKAAAIGGNIISIGILGGRTGEIDFPLFFYKQLRMKGIVVGSREMQEALVNAININGIKPIVDREFPLEQLADAFRYQETGAHLGKICLSF